MWKMGPFCRFQRESFRSLSAPGRFRTQIQEPCCGAKSRSRCGAVDRHVQQGVIAQQDCSVSEQAHAQVNRRLLKNTWLKPSWFSRTTVSARSKGAPAGATVELAGRPGAATRTRFVVARSNANSRSQADASQQRWQKCGSTDPKPMAIFSGAYSSQRNG